MKKLNLDYSEKLLKKIEKLSKADWGDAQEIADILSYDVDDIINDVRNNSYKFCMSEMSSLLSELNEDLMKDVIRLDLNLAENIQYLNNFKNIIKKAQSILDKSTIDFAQ